MNLKQAGGMVPIRTTDPASPYALIPFPDREAFIATYKDQHQHTSDESIERYFQMAKLRSEGSTLTEIANTFGVTKERARQIEAKFLRVMTSRWRSETSSTID
jgi:DNA-directed RNA polymerase, sigma subunit (sigma70/sigma32)